MKKTLLSIGLGWLAGNALLIAIGWGLYFTTSLYLPSGWKVSYNLGRYDEAGGAFEKTQVALIGLGALVAEEALYYNAFRDDQDNLLRGENGNYRLHFAPGELPDVDAFWSITMYGKDSFLVWNPINRYAIGNRTEGLHYNEDGSLDIYISHKEPAEGISNWLPAPKGEFSITLRAYLPSEQLLSGAWLPPGIERYDSNHIASQQLSKAQ
ncbi:hypothetical protein R50073_34090 [Maricurvus nonylphenolicus]|uniref:DUF1214 domain-containing protein n=1 Tax=Maricurvus nonylphenolicus TaxID=1008307 RepID=UPI0036F3B347